MIEVCTSILSYASDISFESEFKAVKAMKQITNKINDTDWIHIDYMDHTFFPAKGVVCERNSLTHNLVQLIRQVSDIKIDVHMMVQEPAKYIEDFARAGADMITFHIESDGHPKDLIDIIRKNDVKVGIALNPGTEAKAVVHYLGALDCVLPMSVIPGKSGQTYIKETTDKIRYLNDIINEHNLTTRIMADGGITLHNAYVPINAGASYIVSDSAINQSDKPQKAIAGLRNVIPIASDHGDGYRMKEAIKRMLTAEGLAYYDFGTHSESGSVDYPDYAEKVAQAVESGRAERGILVCGTGIGMSMKANRYNVRAALCNDLEYAQRAREHNDANILCLGGTFTTVGTAQGILNRFLYTEFDGDKKGGERHKRRIAKL